MRLRFTETVTWETRGRNDGPEFKKDTEHDMDEALAQRWLRRGVAVKVSPRPVVQSQPIAKPEVVEEKPRRGRAKKL